LCRESRIDPVSLWFLTRVLSTFGGDAIIIANAAVIVSLDDGTPD
jgi:hypothetical protein